jgi:hypothetical protein
MRLKRDIFTLFIIFVLCAQSAEALLFRPVPFVNKSTSEPSGWTIERTEGATKRAERRKARAEKRAEKTRSERIVERRQERQRKKRAKKGIVEMAITLDEWLHVAENVPIAERPTPVYEAPVNEKLTKIEPPVRFLVPHNFPAGSQGIDLSSIKKTNTLRSQGVASPDFRSLTYVTYYYSPRMNQLSSEIFIIPLNRREPRIARILNAHVWRANREERPQTGTEEFTRDLYNAFEIVDWSEDSQTILARERVGTVNGGQFRTFLWLVFLEDGEIADFRRCDELQDAIISYWHNERGIYLENFRWDIHPLGWDADDENRAIVLAYAWQRPPNRISKGSRIYLGAWSIERYSGVVRLLSLTRQDFNIRPNGSVVDVRGF